MILNPRRLLAVLFAAALMLAACGSDAATDAEGGNTPSVSIEVVADPMSGHNLFVDVSDFTVAPENASTDPIPGEGHMHLYIDGERKMRFYNTALHLSGLDAGEHTIEVELSQNDHTAYEVDGEPVRASATVTVDESEPGHEHGNHGGEVIDTELDPVPSVDLSVVNDPKSGWNLAITTENFNLTPRDASTELVDGDGHMHLYVDGEKVTRLYGPNWHLAELTEGSHSIEVELSHNNHAAYGLDGSPIRATATIDVSAEEAGAGGHDHNHSDHGDTDQGDSGQAIDMPVGDADVVVTVSYVEGNVEVADDRIDVELGSTVGITIESDVSEELHVHGYDQFIDVTPGEPAGVVFAADVPGLFEVELESSGTFLFEIRVG